MVIKLLSILLFTIQLIFTSVTGDGWMHYDQAQWSNDFNGLETNIEEVVMSNHAKFLYEDGTEAEKPAIGVVFQLQNTTDRAFRFHTPTLLTNTGESINWAVDVSDNLSGEIQGGETKEALLVWYLEESNIDQIESIKLFWTVYDGEFADTDKVTEKYEVELELK
ncbi:hypothetical protein FZW96_08115 [Bacillus sp. BGMRC 2118]|nr:hypothetical protein FZW96_08115 [Bacillus sp. BGMRC 2118]